VECKDCGNEKVAVCLICRDADAKDSELASLRERVEDYRLMLLCEIHGVTIHESEAPDMQTDPDGIPILDDSIRNKLREALRNAK
jgi:hypothetical protein